MDQSHHPPPEPELYIYNWELCSTYIHIPITLNMSTYLTFEINILWPISYSHTPYVLISHTYRYNTIINSWYNYKFKCILYFIFIINFLRNRSIFFKKNLLKNIDYFDFEVKCFADSTQFRLFGSSSDGVRCGLQIS